MAKNCNEHESVIYEAFHVKITNIAEAQFPHLLQKIYTYCLPCVSRFFCEISLLPVECNPSMIRNQQNFLAC